MVYSLIVVLLVLLLDRTLADRGGLNPFSWYDDWVMSVEQRFNGGETNQGMAALALTVGSVFLVVLLIQLILSQMNWLLRFGFDLLCMYFFLQLGAKLVLATGISSALAAGDSDTAESKLAAIPAGIDELPVDAGVSWRATTRLLAGLNSWFFGPVFWYLIFGPAGAALFFTAGIVAQSWNWRNSRFQEFGRAANSLYQILSWVPVRLLAAGYALVGDFEGALGSWRMQSDTWTGSNDQLLITIGLGALGEGEENLQLDTELIDRTVALVYRVVVFWVVLGITVGIAGLLF